MTNPTLSSNVSPPTAFRWLELASLIAATSLDLALAREVARGLSSSPLSLLALFSIAVAAYVAADVVSGLVHFLGDSFGSVETPWLGTTFVLPFRSHHDHPQGICEHDLVETNGNNAFATLFCSVPTLLLVPVAGGGVATGVGAFVLLFTVWLLCTNQIHKWAHVAEPPPIVRALQRAGVLLSPERHASHHAPPYRGGYCVTSGLSNLLLDPIGFFPWLERCVRATLRLPPRSP